MMSWIKERYWCSHHKFHPLNRVWSKSSSIKIGWSSASQRRNNFQDRHMTHTLNRERSLRQVEITWNNLPSNLFDKLFSCISILAYNFLVCQCESSIFMGIRRSILIFSFNKFKVFSCLNNDLSLWCSWLFRLSFP